MSVARHLHTPQPRTGVEVAADAIVAILDARIVPFTPGMIGRLSMATGVPVADIERAWRLKESGHRPPLPARRPTVEQPNTPPAPEPRYAPNYNAKAKAANEHKRAKKEPVPGMRLCSGTCKSLKPKSEFNIKSIARDSCPLGASHALGTTSANAG